MNSCAFGNFVLFLIVSWMLTTILPTDQNPLAPLGDLAGLWITSVALVMAAVGRTMERVEQDRSSLLRNVRKDMCKRLLTGLQIGGILGIVLAALNALLEWTFIGVWRSALYCALAGALLALTSLVKPMPRTWHNLRRTPNGNILLSGLLLLGALAVLPACCYRYQMQYHGSSATGTKLVAIEYRTDMVRSVSRHFDNRGYHSSHEWYGESATAIAVQYQPNLVRTVSRRFDNRSYPASLKCHDSVNNAVHAWQMIRYTIREVYGPRIVIIPPKAPHHHSDGDNKKGGFLLKNCLLFNINIKPDSGLPR